MQSHGQIHLLDRDVERLRAVLDEIPGIVAYFRGPDLILDFANRTALDVSAGPRAVGCPAAEVFREGFGGPGMDSYPRRMKQVMRTGKTLHGWASPAHLTDQAAASYWDYSFIPVRGDDGAVGGVFVHAVDVTRLVTASERAEEAEHRFTTLFDANVVGVTISGEHELYEANDAFLEMIGRTREELAAGLRWTDLTAPEWAEADERAMRGLHEHGVAPVYEKEYLHADGSRVAVLISGSRLSEHPLRVLATVVDLTERKSVEREIATLYRRERDARYDAETAGARTTRLQQITAALSASNSAETIARTVVVHGVESVSASACMFVRGEPGELEAHSVGLPLDVVDEWRRFPLTLPSAVRRATDTAEPVILEGAGAVAEGCPEMATDALRMGSVIALPMVVGGRVLGCLLLAFRDARPVAAEDRDFLAALTRQAAAALDRVHLYENRAYVARKLQEGLLPQRIADIEGAEVAVVYESISGGGEVGGDFYDVFALEGDRWAMAIGDVCGKGTEAAVITGLARHTVRAVAHLRPEPAAVLDFLNGALRRHGDSPGFCTVGFLVLERAAGGGFTAQVSSGGHPFPLIVRADGTVEPIRVSGTMLGVAEDPDLECVTIALAPGDAIMLVTDGVTDARRRGGERFGEQRMLDAIRAVAGGTAAELAGGLETAVRAHHPGPPADDRAILVLRALAQ